MDGWIEGWMESDGVVGGMGRGTGGHIDEGMTLEILSRQLYGWRNRWFDIGMGGVIKKWVDSVIEGQVEDEWEHRWKKLVD